MGNFWGLRPQNPYRGFTSGPLWGRADPSFVESINKSLNNSMQKIVD